MGWLKVDDKLPRNPKIIAGGIEPAWYYLCALTHCAEQMTDGFIADAAVPVIAPHIEDPRSVAETCCQLDLFRRVEGGYTVPDYLEFNPSRASVLARRESDKSRQASRRESQRDTEQTSAVTPSVPSRPVPDVPISHLSTASTELARRVAERVIELRLSQQSNVRSPKAWKAKALENLDADWWAECERVCGLWPNAPLDLLAQAAEGDISPNLRHYPKEAS